MRIGFIGTGNITGALVTGLSTRTNARYPIVLSPRNREKSAYLANQFDNVRVAPDNQDVIDGADLVVLALRPQTALEVTGGLRFHRSQKVLTLLGATPIAAVCRAVAPASCVLRAVPLPSAALGVGPILQYPEDPDVADLLGGVGECIVVSEESHLSLLSAVTALISPFFTLLDTVSGWAVARGVEKRLAERYTVSMFHALCEQALHAPQIGFEHLAEEAATPGGLNEQAHGVISKENGYAVFFHALEAVAERIGKVPSLGRE